MSKLYKKIIITAELELLTGLHIGDSKENAEIGSIDSPVIRRKDNNQPYIPGSSLKGKIRSLLEVRAGISDINKASNPINALFGWSTKNDGNPSRIIVRDAYLTKESAELLKNSAYTDMPYTEVKYENTINRITGTAEHPRQIERVPAGAKFQVEFIINIIGDETQDVAQIQTDFLNLIEQGINLLKYDYLGGSGSRGYGQIKFHNWKQQELNLENFRLTSIDI